MLTYNPLFSSFSLQVIFFSEQTFYGNYSTLGSHTNTIISHTLAYSSRWRRKPWQGLFKFPSLPFRSVSSSCFGSLDIRSPGVFTETFRDHYHLDNCKSTLRRIKSSRLIRVWYYMLLLFFKKHPSHSALCCDISVELSPFAVKSMFWLRSGPITLQEITYSDLVVARTDVRVTNI